MLIILSPIHLLLYSKVLNYGNLILILKTTGRKGVSTYINHADFNSIPPGTSHNNYESTGGFKGGPTLISYIIFVRPNTKS